MTSVLRRLFGVSALAAFAFASGSSLGTAHAQPITYHRTGGVIGSSLPLSRFPVKILVSPDGAHVYYAGHEATLAFSRDALTGTLRLVDSESDASTGVHSPGAAALSPDGMHLYFGVNWLAGGDRLLTYTRDPGTGTLQFTGAVNHGTTLQDVAVSPDGLHVYVVDQSESDVGVFARNPITGALTFVGEYSGLPGLEGPVGIALSPDGANVYVTAINASSLVVFDRDPVTGALSHVESETNGLGGVSGLGLPLPLAVSPDGSHVYVGSDEDAVVVFSRDAGTGAVGFVETQQHGVGGVSGLVRPTAIVPSPDGAYLYVVARAGEGSFAHNVTVFARNPATGRLTFVEADPDAADGDFAGRFGLAVSPDGAHLYQGQAFSLFRLVVFARDAGTGEVGFVQQKAYETSIEGLDGVEDVVVSPGGEHVYVVSDEARSVSTFSRDAGTGDLTFEDVIYQGEVPGFSGLSAAALSPDGAALYATSADTDQLAVFQRDGTSGLLTFLEFHTEGIGGVSGLDGPSSVAVSLDGAHVYVAGEDGDSLAIFSRDGITGALTPIGSVVDGVAGVSGLAQPTAMRFSADGDHLYVTGRLGSLVVFERDAGTGGLTLLQAAFDDLGGVDGIAGAAGVGLSPDDRHVYVTGPGDAAVAVFSRDTTTGLLSFAGVFMDPAIGSLTGLFQATELLVTPDGRNVLTAHSVFARDAATGMLNFVNAVPGFYGEVAVAPDGAHVYSATGGDPAVLPIHTGGFSGCGSLPQAGCRLLGTTGVGKLVASAGSKPPRLVWKWVKGETTVTADLGHPLINPGTDYALCLYDESGPPALLLRALVPSDGALGGRWDFAAGGFKFRDKPGYPEGVLKALLRVKSTGLAGPLLVKAKGPRFDLALPLPTPLRTQLQASNGNCWEVLVTAGDVFFNDGTKFKAVVKP